MSKSIAIAIAGLLGASGLGFASGYYRGQASVAVATCLAPAAQQAPPDTGFVTKPLPTTGNKGY
jgi:hypothetical protein